MAAGKINKINKINKDMKIIDILNLDSGTANIFLQHGLHCLGCPSANGESLEDACIAHSIDADELLGKLNTHIENVDTETRVTSHA